MKTRKRNIPKAILVHRNFSQFEFRVVCIIIEYFKQSEIFVYTHAHISEIDWRYPQIHENMLLTYTRAKKKSRQHVNGLLLWMHTRAQSHTYSHATAKNHHQIIHRVYGARCCLLVCMTSTYIQCNSGTTKFIWKRKKTLFRSISKRSFTIWGSVAWNGINGAKIRQNGII